MDFTGPPFDQLKNIQPLAPNRSGRTSLDHVRHHLYAARDRRSNARVLIKLTAKPGLIYQYDLTNEIASLTTINRELPDSRYFPVLGEHGRLRDGRVYLISSLFDEFPLASDIDSERVPARMVAHLKTAMEAAKAVAELHRLGIFHVDLNPMNILRRTEKGAPVIRIVDFESSYELGRHSSGVSYNPPTTPGYSAPEVSRQVPDPRADVFSLGAVLYTMIAGYQWTWHAEAGSSVQADSELDTELKDLLLRAVAPEPARRYPTIDAFQAALAAYLERIWPGRSW